MFSVGLTGGIGSGKSTVADQFARHGAAIVDTDAIAHALTAAGGAAIESIAHVFGRDHLTTSGALDRAKMRTRVFSDAQAKAQLEAILHPMIRAEAEAQADAAAGAPYVIFVVPLLVESGIWHARVARVLVIDCSASAQIARVQRRNGWNADAVRAVMRMQAPRGVRLDAADDVIVNEDAAEALDARVARLHRHYAAAAVRGAGNAPRQADARSVR
jgi:dephospho-CoA kinase